MSARTRRCRSRAASAAALGLLLLPALTACSDGEGSDPEALPPTSESPAESTTSEPPAPEVETKATIRRVTGALSETARDKLRTKVTAAVDAWIDGAYVGGDYPRSDFEDAFASFTPQAQVRARKDERLMSNATIGEQLDGVAVFARRLRIDALAVDGRAQAVTVDVRLGLGLSGDIERRERVVGTLFLTFRPGGWQVFGYDVKRGAV